MVIISDRPAEVEDRAGLGTWREISSLDARGATDVDTLVECTAHFVLHLLQWSQLLGGRDDNAKGDQDLSEIDHEDCHFG